MTEPRMVYSDNPYIDAIVYYSKYLVIHSIIKEESDADNSETMESIKTGNVYLNKVRLGTITPEEDIDIVHEPENYYNKQESWRHYIERNEYYRKLAGYPPIPTIEEYMQYNMYTASGDGAYQYHVQMTQDQINHIKEVTGIVDSSEYCRGYINMITNEKIIAEIEKEGIIEAFKAEHYGDRHYDYLNYLGKGRSLPVAHTRSASKFQLLFIPELPDIDYNDIKQKFEILYEKNRLYVMACVYSDAMAIGNTYYDKFIIILLKIMTMMDMITDVFDYLIHKDIFDSRTIRYLFESYGVDYYSEIPTKYQIRMIKNMNNLLKYKSTNQNIVDICNLFGFDDITVFKYYLLKIRESEDDILDPDGNPDPTQMYSLKFLKVPIEETSYTKYINDVGHIVDYDTVTYPDPYWVGMHDDLGVIDANKERDRMRNDILRQDFSCEPTKYLSIDSTEDVAKLAADLCYFYNMLFDNKIENFGIKVPILSDKEIRIGDLFSYIIALGYVYNDKEDDITQLDLEKGMYLYGFNFDTDIDVFIHQYFRDHPTAEFDEDLEWFEETARRFKGITGSSIESYEVFREIYTNNRHLYDDIVEGMNSTDNYRVYSAYKAIHDAFLTRKFSIEYFEIKDESGIVIQTPETYTEYLEIKGYDTLTRKLAQYKNMTNTEQKQANIASDFEEIISCVETFMHDDSEFNNIWSIVPTRSANFLVSCLTKVISFFKSYKTQIVSMNAIFKIDDSDNNYHMLEDVDLEYDETPHQSMEPVERDATTFIEKINGERMETLEKVYITTIPGMEVTYG